ncbi:MAG: hypothetical protein ACK5NG_00725 [Chthoniobacterales bacterium]
MYLKNASATSPKASSKSASSECSKSKNPLLEGDIEPEGTDAFLEKLNLVWHALGHRITWSGSLSVQGAKTQSAKTIAFDSPSDGIIEQNADTLRFRSYTTGDSDGLFFY